MRPLPCRFITGAGRLGGEHRAGEVDVDDLGPFLVGQVVEVRERDRFVVGRVVDQDVEPAEALDHVVDHRLHLVALRHVAAERRRADLMLLEVAHHAVGLVLALGIDDRDVTALCRERVTDALAQSAIAASDDGDLALQIHCFPRCSMHGHRRTFRRRGEMHCLAARGRNGRAASRPHTPCGTGRGAAAAESPRRRTCRAWPAAPAASR